MRWRKLTYVVAIILASFCISAAQRPLPHLKRPNGYRPFTGTQSVELDKILEQALMAARTASTSGKVKENEIAATVFELSDLENVQSASYRGSEPIYPASVVKLFYLAAFERDLADGRISYTDELRRGERDMIVDSSNEATQYILDVLTGTSSGGELPAAEFKAWAYKRNRVNRYFSLLGYSSINADQKTFCEDAYGIEQQFRNYNGENRNMLTTDATARLMAEIVLMIQNDLEHSMVMQGLLRRDPFKQSADVDSQDTGFTGRAIAELDLRDAKLWSKAGWTSKARHDVAYIEMPNKRKVLFAIFTENHAADREIITAFANSVLKSFDQR